MAKFCTQCGRPLQEGEICNCRQTGAQRPPQRIAPQMTSQMQRESGQGMNPAQSRQRTVQENYQQNYQQTAGQRTIQGNNGQPTVQNHYGQMGGNGNYQQGMVQRNYQPNPQVAAASEYAQQSFYSILSVIKKPVIIGNKQVAGADTLASIVFLVVQGIFSSLFALLACNKLYGLTQSAAGLLGNYASGLGDVSGIIKMPTMRIILVTLLASVALNCILALLLMLGHKIVGSDASFQQMLSVVSIRSALLVPSTIASMLVFVINYGFGITFFYLSSIWGFVAMTMVMTDFLRDSQKDLFSLISAIIYLVFIMVTIFAMTKLYSYYLPDVARAALSGVNSLLKNPSQLLEGIMGELF